MISVNLRGAHQTRFAICNNMYTEFGDIGVQEGTNVSNLVDLRDECLFPRFDVDTAEM